MERHAPSEQIQQRSATEPPRPGGTPQGGAGVRIGREYRPLGKPVGCFAAAEALLRVPGRIIFEMRNGNSRLLAMSFIAVAAVCFLAYGFTVGMFSWGDQLWVAPLKIIGGVVLCALLCFPSLVVFTLLSGSEAALGEIFVLLTGTIALAGLLLVGFGPVSWVFSQSTESVAFMGGLHLLFWIIALYYGSCFLGAAMGFLHGGSGRQLFLWSVLFALVSLQMMTTLRPIVGTSDRFLHREKKFFLTHWADTLDSRAESSRHRGH